MAAVDGTGSRPPRALTRRFRGPFARWPRAADATLALLVLAFTVLLTDGPGDSLVRRDLAEVPVWVLVVFVVANAALYWRRSHPLVVVGVGVASMAVLLGSGFADTGGVAILGLYATGRYSDADLLGELAVAATVLVLLLDGLTADLPWGEVAFAVVVAAGAWVLGRSRRLRDERAAQYVREQEAERRRVVAEERTRIARELHDVVAHRVSLMTVQAGAAATVADHDPAAARGAMEAVEEAGRQALDELRHLLGVLRPELDQAARDPQPGVADLPRLAERVRAAGPALDLVVTGVDDDLPAPVQLSIYRIVQEALTNVLKHAGEGATVAVEVLGTEDSVHVEVRDDGGSRRPGQRVAAGTDDLASHGIIGMRERAHLLGGSLHAGATDDGGFGVTADLPTSSRETSPTTEPTS